METFLAKAGHDEGPIASGSSDLSEEWPKSSSSSSGVSPQEDGELGPVPGNHQEDPEVEEEELEFHHYVNLHDLLAAEEELQQQELVQQQQQQVKDGPQGPPLGSGPPELRTTNKEDPFPNVVGYAPTRHIVAMYGSHRTPLLPKGLDSAKVKPILLLHHHHHFRPGRTDVPGSLRGPRRPPPPGAGSSRGQPHHPVLLPPHAGGAFGSRAQSHSDFSNVVGLIRSFQRLEGGGCFGVQPCGSNLEMTTATNNLSCPPGCWPRFAATPQRLLGQGPRAGDDEVTAGLWSRSMSFSDVSRSLPAQGPLPGGARCRRPSSSGPRTARLLRRACGPGSTSEMGCDDVIY